MRTINLIPQEGKRSDESRRRILMLAGLGALFLVLLGAVTVWRQGAVRDAEDELNAQIGANQQLQAEINALAGARDLETEYLAAVGTQTLVLQNDISWGLLLNDLGRLIPDRVWVTTYTGTANRFSPDAPPSTSAGELSVSGVAFDNNDVAAWLRVLDSDRFPSVTGTWATGLTQSAIADRETVNFGSTASLTEGALSNRLQERTPVVP